VLGLKIETARNYSRKIAAKPGTRGQANLVRIVLTSVLAIGCLPADRVPLGDKRRNALC